MEWFERGVEMTDDPGEVIRCYGEAIRLKPDFIEAHYNRGLARRDLGDADGAMKDYTEAIRLAPDDAET